jgi:hypothetical membrane protein
MKQRSYWRKRIALPHISTRSALMLIVLYVLGVFATAIYVTNDPNWSRWHISYLGEHPGLGADIFNYGVMFGGVIMVWFSFRMHAYLMGENQRRVDVPRIRATGVSLILLLIAIGVYGVGMFPLQYGNLPHDIFGYSIYVLCLVLCIASPWLLPGMRRRFYLIPYVFHLLIFAIFVLFWANISESMYLAEVTTFLSLIWWLDMVTSGRMYRDNSLLS